LRVLFLPWAEFQPAVRNPPGLPTRKDQIMTSAATSQRENVNVGTGRYRYQALARWGQLPPGWSFIDVAGVATDSHDRVYVFNRSEHPVMVFDRDGRLLRSWGEGLFKRPHGIHIGPDDAVYCTDDLDHTVKKFTTEGKPLLTLGTSGKPSETGI